MKPLHLFTAAMLTLAVVSPAQAFKTSTPGGNAAFNQAVSKGNAQGLLDVLNPKGAYAADFYRLSFAQIMGLVFFDPNTPDIRACEKDMLGYHLPVLTNRHTNFTEMRDQISAIMGEIYTPEELEWMVKFYSSPFGKRMWAKHLQVNERISRMMAQRYANLKPQFQEVYRKVAERCGKKSAVPLDAPKLSKDLLNPPPNPEPLVPPVGAR